MTKHIYEGKLFDQATSAEHLDTRLELNRKYSSTNFDDWLLARLDVQKNEDILDVGCGTGAQTIPFLKAVGAGGSVSSLDISADSILELKKRAGTARNLDAIAVDMALLKETIQHRFRKKTYDLGHSSYALYYSPKRMEVLEVMRDSLKPSGRLAVFTPNQPHGMVDFARRFHPIAAEIDESLIFGPSILEPFFRRNYWDVVVHFFHNKVRVTSVDDAVRFYQATTYYSRSAEPEFRKKVTAIVEQNGCFEYEKNGYLIIGAGSFGKS